MGAKQAKEHHLVPKFWLRAFAEDGHLRQRLRDGREYCTPVKSAAKSPNFNTDPLARGEPRVALETYLADRVDDQAARAMRLIRRGVWPLSADDHDHLVRALGWQLVRTSMFRSWNAQVGARLTPVVYGHQMVVAIQERLGRHLTEDEGVALFWEAYRRAPEPKVFSDPQQHLRAPLQGLAYALDYLTSSGRQLVLLEAARPTLVLGDTGVIIRRTSGTYSIRPPLLPAASEMFAPISPTHLLISTRTPQRYQDGVLTSALAQQANKGAASWCQAAVYRLPSMRWPRYLRLDPQPRRIPAPRIAPARPSTGQDEGPAYRPVLTDPALLRLWQQFGGTPISND
ncbi:DUF4238 domain-containing protein [Streptomyces sp. NPDC059688]|uniref:DUF4238 domain-containing protein n=1 Tax=Streptomyces sp. NPDC059688 TaxID=3346906 RepID=UPI00369C1B57